MSEWQPIETAPKDGTKVLAAHFGDKSSNWYGRMAVDFYHDAAAGDAFTGWGAFNSRHWPATHWMPLPEPPK